MENNTITVKFVEGILDSNKLDLLKKLIDSTSPGCEIKVIEIPVSCTDAVIEMVTSCVIYIDDALLRDILKKSRFLAVLFIKKLSVILRYFIKDMKTIINEGDKTTETPCSASIQSTNVNIHIPLNVNDKKLERCIENVILYLSENSSLLGEETISYYDEKKDRMVTETKQSYVYRTYIESGLVKIDDK